jgi:hypothetical protein
MFEKTQKKDHIKATVEGTKHEGKIFVQKLTEANQDFSILTQTRLLITEPLCSK